MKANVITNVLLGVLTVLLIVCTAIIQQEIRESRSVMQELLDKQPKVTVVESPATAPPPNPGTPTHTAPTAVTATQTKPMPAAPATPSHDIATPVANADTHTAPTDTTPASPAAPAAPPPPPSAEDIAAKDWAQYGEQVTGIIRNLLDGQYDPVIKQFNAEMKSALPKVQLAMVMDAARAAHGALDHIVSHAPMGTQLPPNVHAFVVTAATQRGNPLVFTITLDEKNQIAGLFLR